MLERKIAPAYKTIEKIEMIKAEKGTLRNGLPVYSINSGTQELIKIEFLFSAGMYYQEKPLIAASVNTMIEEGTSRMSASEIADAIDYYGAFLETSIGQDTASVALYSLNRHLIATLPVVEQIIKDATFPKNELNIYLQNKKQKYLVNQQKVANIARKGFVELLFGEKHPYGINVKETDYDSLTRNELLKFYKAFYSSNNCKIILAGKIEDSTFQLLDNHFGGNDWFATNDFKSENAKIFTTKQSENLILKKDALQSAIRIGKILFNRTHPDYQSLQLLNAIYGGYFGSRLMSNIREDKGYTYGIGSGIVSLHNGGYFFISTEVGVDVCKNAVNEIYFEMERLSDELISADELILVQNYLLGTFLRSVDGPFAMAERFKSILEYDLSYDYFENYLKTIKSTTSVRLRELANHYFQKKSMIELVVGKK